MSAASKSFFNSGSCHFHSSTVLIFTVSIIRTSIPPQCRLSAASPLIPLTSILCRLLKQVSHPSDALNTVILSYSEKSKKNLLLHVSIDRNILLSHLAKILPDVIIYILHSRFLFEKYRKVHLLQMRLYFFFSFLMVLTWPTEIPNLDALLSWLTVDFNFRISSYFSWSCSSFFFFFRFPTYFWHICLSAVLLPCNNSERKRNDNAKRQQVLEGVVKKGTIVLFWPHPLTPVFSYLWQGGGGIEFSRRLQIHVMFSLQRCGSRMVVKSNFHNSRVFMFRLEGEIFWIAKY